MDILTIISILIFLIGLVISYKIGFKSGSFKKNREWEKELPGHRKEAILKSRAVLGGSFTEQLAPYLPDFPFNPLECKFLGKPVDFLVFEGLDEKHISEIVFVEVKSGKSNLSKTEKSLKEAIKNKKVRWVEYRIPEEITKNKEN